MVVLRHPSYAQLNRFADGALAPREHRRVTAHLAQCSRCRGEVAFIRQAGDLARSLETPPLPDALLDEVLARRAEGDRVLLPLESPGARPEPRRLIPAAAAAVVVLLAGLFVTTGLLEADHGGVWFEPERPVAGDVVTVRYRNTEFAGEDLLRLKARYQTEDGRQWEQIVGILERGADPVFTLHLTLPDSVVYAAFVVEDTRGEEMDSNNERLWDMVVYGPDGRPSREALWAQTNDLFRRNTLRAVEAARTFTELYPDSPLGWVARYLAERSSASDPEAFDGEHMRQFRRLERLLTENPPADPDELYALAYYAAQLGDLVSSEYWLRRAEARGSGSALAYTARSFHLIMQAIEGRPPADALRDLEEVWQDAPFIVPQVSDAWLVALMTGNWESAMRWLPRYIEARGPLMAVTIIDDLLQHFPTEQVAGWVLSEADSLLFAAAQRSMALPRWLFERRVATGRQEGLALLAAAAAGTGDLQAAGALARKGLDLAWHTPSLDGIGSVLLAAGDTASAAAAFARVAADPMGSPPPDAVVARSHWAERVADARAQLNAYVLRESVMGYPGVEMGTPGRPTVVTFRGTCTGLGDWLRQVDRAVPGAAIQVVLHREFGQADFPACDLPVSVHLDRTGEISRAFGVRGRPSYYVLDGQGRIRFADSRPEFVARQLAALQTATYARVDE